MSRLNILGVIKQIKSNTNAYLPIIEAVVNSIDAIKESGRKDGKIQIILKRDTCIEMDASYIAPVKSIEIIDNGIGFTKDNRDSFDTFYSDTKLSNGGKGFGRFMFLKYFSNASVESIYKDGDAFFKRAFDFGKQFDIVINETNNPIEAIDIETHLYLCDLINPKFLDKGLETISRKILEELLVFFIDKNDPCPSISIIDQSTGESIIINDYLIENHDIQFKSSIPFSVTSSIDGINRDFIAVTFLVFYANNQKSKIILTGHNREVTETPLSHYIPEFEDDFYIEERRGDSTIRKNYIVITYVMGDYLNDTVSLERETFDFEKTCSSQLYPLSRLDIETRSAEVTREQFVDDVTTRENKKADRIRTYVNDKAPWHRFISKSLPLNSIPYHATEEQIELALQKEKFKQEQENRIAIKEILDSDEESFNSDISELVARISESSKNDLTHYVCSRKEVLKLFKQLLKRHEDGSTELEREVHNLIFPMGETSETIEYGDHNLWLLDERLVFSEFIASDKKISKKISPTEPDLIIFDKKQSFRNGDNEFSNPLTVFEFKRPKRTIYGEGEDPIAQIGNYVEEIRAGKYETPEGIERVKVNDCTPVYGYLVCDLCPKIDYFAKKIHQLTESPDKEGYFGFHSGYKMYIEIISFKKLLSDSELRNRIFFKKLNIE